MSGAAGSGFGARPALAPTHLGGIAQIGLDHRPNGSSRPPIDANERMERFVALLERALREPVAAERLAFARTRVRLQLTDGDIGVTLLLDRNPVEVTTVDTGDAEVRLWLPSDALDVLASEADFMPMKITAGEVRYEGHVRKFLRVIPILRRALIEASTSAASASNAASAQ